MAIISLNKNRLNTIIDDAEGENSFSRKTKKAKILLNLLKEPSKFLATIQVGITLAGFWLVLLLLQVYQNILRYF